MRNQFAYDRLTLIALTTAGFLLCSCSGNRGQNTVVSFDTSGLALKALIADLQDPERRESAIAELVAIGPAAVDPLIETLHQSPDEYARLGAARALADIGGQRSADALTDAVGTGDVKMAVAAYRFLVRRGRPGTESVLIKALDSYGSLTMAEDFANCGNPALNTAAGDWVKQNHYILAAPPVNEETLQWGGKPAQGWPAEFALFHFDDSLASASGVGPAKAVGTAFVAGKWGSGLVIASGGVLSYPAAGILDLRGGTIEMWISPRFEGSDAIYAEYNHPLLLYAKASDQFILAENVARSFYAGSVISRKFTGPGGGDISTWKAAQWHHIAFTYSSGRNRQRLYIDGMLVSQNSSAMPVPSLGDGTLTLDGNPFGPSSAFVIDELRILGAEKGPVAIQDDVERARPFSHNEVSSP